MKNKLGAIAEMYLQLNNAEYSNKERQDNKLRKAMENYEEDIFEDNK
jgi:hypothetical protein